MERFRLVLSLFIILALAVLCQQVIHHSLSNQENKGNYAELNHVKYGLLSIGEWKRQITAILEEEINKLNLTKATERDLRKHIEDLLKTLIDKIYVKVKEGNSASVEGWFKQAFINIFVSLDDIKKGVPDYANAVIHEIKKAKTRKQIKSLLRQQLEQYSGQTFDLQNSAPLSRILLATGSRDIETARVKVDQAISAKQQLIVAESLLMILLTAALFALAGFSRRPLASSEYVFLVLSLCILLIAAVTTPMIDLEAKLTELSFVVMGHTIHFENQVLYFQSKSLLDVFWNMITYKDIPMRFVGVLLINFSLIFPLLKILSTFGYFYNFHQARENPVVKFFVLKSGKWSMADVMVVAIFMAYIGFNGMITGLFGQLRAAGGQELTMLATNGTSLQPGYYLFLAYTLLAIFLSSLLTRKQQAQDRKQLSRSAAIRRAGNRHQV